MLGVGETVTGGCIGVVLTGVGDGKLTLVVVKLLVVDVVVVGRATGRSIVVVVKL